MDKVFELCHRDSEKVVLKVNADDPLVVAMHPYISSDMAYITVTRGNEHVLTVVKKDGTTFSFTWGESGHTLISKNLETLKKKVISFIENDNHILLEWNDSQPVEANIFFNSNYKLWQLTLRGKGRLCAHWWSKDAKSYEEMATDVIPYVHACGWEHYVAVTGIDCWRAIF